MHSANAIHSPLQIEAQIQQFETQNTEKAQLDYQNQLKFNELNYSNFSITKPFQFPSLISTKNSNTLNTPRAQSLSVFTSIHLIHTSSKMNQQVSAKKVKSSFQRNNTRISPGVSSTDNAAQHKPLQSPPHSKLSTSVTDSPQVMSFDSVIGKAFNKKLTASLTRKHAVLKEVRECIVRSNKNRLKQLNRTCTAIGGI